MRPAIRSVIAGAEPRYGMWFVLMLAIDWNSSTRQVIDAAGAEGAVGDLARLFARQLNQIAEPSWPPASAT